MQARLSPRVPLFCSYHILTSSVIYYWTHALQHGIYLFNKKRLRGPGSDNNELHPEGFRSDLNLLKCAVEEGMGSENLLCPQLRFQCVNDQLNEKQILFFQCYRNELKQTRSRFLSFCFSLNRVLFLVFLSSNRVSMQFAFTKTLSRHRPSRNFFPSLET